MLLRSTEIKPVFSRFVVESVKKKTSLFSVLSAALSPSPITPRRKRRRRKCCLYTYILLSCEIAKKKGKKRKKRKKKGKEANILYYLYCVVISIFKIKKKYISLLCPFCVLKQRKKKEKKRRQHMQARQSKVLWPCYPLFRSLFARRPFLSLSLLFSLPLSTGDVLWPAWEIFLALSFLFAHFLGA